MNKLEAVILFVDGSRKWITKEQYNTLYEESATLDKFDIDGNVYKFHSVSKILTAKEYREQYPEEVRDEQPVYPELSAGDVVNRILSPIDSKNKQVRVLESLIKGISKYIDSEANNGTGKPEKLKEKMLSKLNNIKGR